MKRERVTDWEGGLLPIFWAVELPGGQLFYGELVETAEYVPLAHGLAIPADLTAPVRAADGTLLATLSIGVVDGRPACTAIRAAEGQQLTTLFLKRLPGIGQIVKAQVAGRAVRVMRRDDGEIIGARYPDASDPSDSPGAIGFDAGRQAVIADLKAAPPGKRASYTLTPDFLREVAAVYRDARARGISTQKAIQERWPTSAANARRWVDKARDAGALGKAPDERQGGEVNPSEQREGES